MSDGELTQSLADALHGFWDAADQSDAVTALLPVVRKAQADELRSLGRDLLAANYEGPDGGAPSEKGWPHFDCEDILGEYVMKRADALEAGR